MSYFEPRVPAKSCRVAWPAGDASRSRGSGPPQRARWPKGLNGEVEGGEVQPGLPHSPPPLACWQSTRRGRTPAPRSELASPRKRSPPLPSNDAQGCIATRRMRVPGPQYPPPRYRRPLPSRAGQAPRLHLGLACWRQQPPNPACYLLPQHGLWLVLTRFRPPLPFTCDFAKKCHQTRASTPARWYLGCACARLEVPTDDLPRSPETTPRAHAPHHATPPSLSLAASSE